MSNSLGLVVVLPTSTYSTGQISLINYVNALSHFDTAPFTRDAFDPENMPERALAAITAGQRAVSDGYFLSAAGLVARAVRNERVLLQALGQDWRLETRFVTAVRRELSELRGAIRPVHEELKAWRKTLKGFHFDGFHDPSETFDIRQEEPLRGLLRGLQAVFHDKIRNAEEILVSYGPKSFLGIEDYFQVSRRRRSGPVLAVPLQPEASNDSIAREI